VGDSPRDGRVLGVNRDLDHMEGYASCFWINLLKYSIAVLLIVYAIFSLHFPSAPLSPSDVGPLNTARGLWSAVSSPSGVWGGAVAEIELGTFWVFDLTSGDDR